LARGFLFQKPVSDTSAKIRRPEKNKYRKRWPIIVAVLKL